MTKATSKSKASRTARTRTVAYDVAEQLRTPDEMAAYLDAWLEEAPDDAAGIARLSRESLYKALSETGNPSFATVLKVARAVGLKFHAQPA
jgi:DNA-binding phage protein